MKTRRTHAHTNPTGLSQFLFGVDYYPEHDSESDLAEDPRRLAAAHVNVVRMTDFSWDRLEPEEGRFEFEFFDKHIERLGREGIKTMLCTPTAGPPLWLVQKHPEVLRIHRDGRVMVHGSRQHASHCSPVFKDYCARITRAMAEHYAGNPLVIGWQTDNEFHCHFSEDYSESARIAFRKYLRAKYGKIDALNEAWGTVFWSQTYDDFESVDFSYPDRPTHENPGQKLDYTLFLSTALTEFQAEQVEILRAANPFWWITHNGIFDNIDYRELARDLDFMAVDVYPMFAEVADRPAWGARILAKTRSYTGNFIVPELQSGPGGQSDYFHDRPEPGQMRLFAWQSVAHGADGLLHFRWRSCRFGAEEYWEGVLDHDNKPRARYDEFVKEGTEFARLGDKILGTVLRPEVGILYDTGMAEMAHRPLTHGLPSPTKVADLLYTAWWEAGYSVGYVHPLDDLSGCKLLIMPSFSVVMPEVVLALEAWVAAGGVLLLLPRCGRKDGFGRVLSETPPGPLAQLAGCLVEEYSRVNGPAHEGGEPRSFEWAGETGVEWLWREVFVPQGGDVVGTWQTGRLKGAPAVMSNQFGQGRTISIGTYPNAALARAWLAPLAKVAGVNPLLPVLPRGVEVTLRGSESRRLLFVLNHTDESKVVETVPESIDLITGAATGGELVLGPYGVSVLEMAG